LRCGEILALEWRDVDLSNRQLSVARSEWKGHITEPKGGRVRHVPMTEQLTEALKTARHLRWPRVIYDEKGRPLTQKIVQVTLRRIARRARVKPGVHILRHTFCSHLAMKGAPARAIQELAGHQDLTTTQRYMHLTPAAFDAAIRLLDGPPEGGFRDPKSRGENSGGGGKSALDFADSLNKVGGCGGRQSATVVEFSNDFEKLIGSIGRK